MVISYREILKREEEDTRKNPMSTITRRVEDVCSGLYSLQMLHTTSQIVGLQPEDDL